MIRLALLPQAAVALAVLVTCLVHTTLWSAVVWLATRPLVGLDAAARNRLWRAALVGPLFSVTAALLLPTSLAVTVAPPQHATPDPSAMVVLSSDERADSQPDEPAGTPPLADLPPAADGMKRTDLRAAVRELFWLAMALGALVRVGRLIARRRRFWRRLRDRQRLSDGPACERLAALASRSRVRGAVLLTVSPAAASPMALGRREICLPPRALEELDGPALDAVMAHELAHLERSDNGWLTIATVIEAALFFQPLARWVRRALEDSAERACDERAVALTDGALALAQSIAVVAGWQVGAEEAMPAASMARATGDVVGRVQALLGDVRQVPAARRARRARIAVVAAAACGMLAPAVAEVSAADGPGPARGDWQPPPVAKKSNPPAATPAAPVPRPTVPPAAPAAPAVPTVEPPPPSLAAPAPPRPPLPPRPPVAPPPPPVKVMPVPPIDDLLSGVLDGVVPAAAAFGQQMAGLAAQTARLEMERADLKSKPEDRRTAADRTRLAELERQIATLKERQKSEEKRIDREMNAWGKRFEQRFGKDFEKKMERWGNEYGAQMEAWGKRYGAEFERWGKEHQAEVERLGSDRHLADRRGAGDAAARLKEEKRRLDESRRQVDEAQRSVDEARRRLDEAQRGVEEAQRRADENLARPAEPRGSAPPPPSRGGATTAAPTASAGPPLRPPPPATAPRPTAVPPEPPAPGAAARPSR
jgi:bla regulator protein BlaR1